MNNVARSGVIQVSSDPNVGWFYPAVRAAENSGIVKNSLRRIFYGY